MTRTCTAALVTILVVAFAGATAAPAQDDDLPPLPPLPKPSDKAVFDLIVEGTGGAYQSANGSGNNGVCDIFTRTQSFQTYEYGRGKGVRVVFSKYKFPGAPPLVLLKRSGQSQGVKFTVVGSYETGAEGSASRSGSNAVLCVPTDETVGDEQGCGPSGTKRTVLNLNSSFEGDLVLEPVAAAPGVPGVGCGSNGVETISGAPLYSWPYFAPLGPEPIPVTKIFGKKKAFKVNFEAPPKNTETDHVAGSFVIRSINTGDHRAVARFVRNTKG